MSKLHTVFPEGVDTLVQERIALWRSLDEANAQTTQIKTLKQEVHAWSDPATRAQLPPVPPSQGSDDLSNPPRALGLALHGLQQEMAKVKEIEDKLDECEQEIARLSNQRMLVIGGSIVGLLIVMALFVMILFSIF